MLRKCKNPDCNKETINTVFQARQNKKTREHWIKAVYDAHRNLVTLSVCGKHCKQSYIVASRDIKDASGKIIQRPSIIRLCRLKNKNATILSTMHQMCPH